MRKNYADMDPTEEMRAVKEELSREFPTAKAFGEYVRSRYPLNSPPEPSRNLHQVSAKTGKRLTSRRRKALTHA